MKLKTQGLLLLLSSLLNFVNGQPISAVNKLKEEVMENYNKNTLPTNNPSRTFVLHVIVGLLDLGDLDEVQEKLTTTIGFYMEWTDESIVWNETEHSGIRRITMHQSDMWLPLFSVRNLHYTADKSAPDKDLEKITYKSNGEAQFYNSRTIQSTCDLDTTNFPFDHQTCTIKLSLSGFLDDNIQIKTNRNIKQTFFKDGAWDIVRVVAEAATDKPSMTITFDFVRKPLFMLVNVLLPIIVLALLTPLVFILPSESGDRVGFAITCLLAISVYMTIIGDNLPPNSDPMPLVTIMLFVWYILTSSIIFVVIINIKIYNWANKKPVSKLALKFVRFVSVTWICKSTTLLATKEETRVWIDDENNEKAPGSELAQTEEDEGEKDVPRITWKHVSYAIDRFFLVLIYIIMILFASGFLIILKYKQVQLKEKISHL